MEPSQAIVSKMLRAAPDAILAVDNDGIIIFANDEAERLFGWNRGELLGSQVELLVPEAHIDSHQKHRAAYATQPKPRLMGEQIQLSARRKNGDTFPAEIALSTVSDELAALIVMVAVRDVSDRIVLEAERQQQALLAQQERSDRLESLGQLAGGIAHDFNNVLGVILNYATLLQRKLTDPQDLSDIQAINGAAERARGLIRQLLNFASRGATHLEPLDVNVVVRETGSMLDRTFGKDIEIKLALDPEAQVALADRQQLEQIILNLAINARDAMAEGGRLTIATGTSGAASPDDLALVEPDDVVLRVIDEGAGMSPEVLRRAFEPFFTTKPQGQGTGLGLATVYGIVRQSGGRVTINSTVGAGTTVTVVLPAGRDHPSTPVRPASSVSRGKERLLVVADEDALRFGDARLLAAEGYDVLTAANGIEALMLLDAHTQSIDLVVTDVVMPKMGGVALAQALARRQSELPILLIADDDAGEPPDSGLLLHAPVARDAMLPAIRELLDG
jgi:PAS domain S-box-containing protein